MEEIQNTNNRYVRISSEINLRLAALVKHFTDGNAAAFARSIKVAQQRFDRLLKPDKESGKYPIIKPEIVEKILTRYPNVRDIWLLSGSGPMLDTMEDLKPSFHISLPSGVPYFPLDFIHEFELIRSKKAEYIGYPVDFKAFNHADFWCNVTGRSMEPEIVAGDFVAMKEVYDKNEGVLYGEMYGIVTKKFCIIRRVAKGSTDLHIKLIPSNKSAEYAEQEILRSSIDNLFLILGYTRNL